MPTTIREIGDYAFCGCSRLMRVQIPEQVERIGIAALEGTPYLSAWPGDYVTEGQQILISYQGTETDVTVPEYVRSIAAGAFENCIGLRRVTIPSSVSGIGMLAFAGCNDLESCFISDGVQDIGAYAFSSCINLREIRIPGTIRSIGNHAFAFCRSLEEIQLPGMLRKLEGAVFMHCTNLKAIEIPYSTTEICSYAFYECDALEEVILPPAVSVIGIWAFSRCTNLKHCSIYNTKCQIDEETEVFPEQTIISAVINSAGNEWAWRHQYAFEPLDFIYGDMNGNGMQDIGDAGRILEIYGMMAVSSPLKGRKEDYFAADCNQDGNIDIWDASMVLNAYATAAAAL